MWIIIMFAFLGFMLVILPIFLLCLDRTDYQRVTKMFYNLEFNILKKVAKKRFKPIEVVTYR